MTLRDPKASFGRAHNHVHWGPHFFGGIRLALEWFKELVIHIPMLLRLRSFYKNRTPNTSPRVAIFSDNLDETNGIAINSRLVTQKMRSMGFDVYLIGIAFHSKPNGLVENSGTILIPQKYSMEQLGYDQSELAIPSFKEILTFFKRRPIDLLEIETPSTGGALALVAAKIIGIPVFSHYRTDLVSYTYALVQSKFMQIFIIFWVKWFSRFSTPIVVPSTHFKEKLQKEYGIAPQDIVQIRRGINLKDFNPSKAQNFWDSYSTKPAIRFLFVGRVSKEKELVFLETVWRKFRTKHNDVEFMVVGDGPYKAEWQANMADCPEVFFAGKHSGANLAASYAESHFFLFPSGTDTFGNVVVESLASGSPVLVSDSGGPKDIADEGQTGFILPFKDEEAWLNGLEKAYSLAKSDEYPKWSEQSSLNAQKYSLTKSAQAFWDFFIQQIDKNHSSS